jgi:hypothetical protein
MAGKSDNLRIQRTPYCAYRWYTNIVRHLGEPALKHTRPKRVRLPYVGSVTVTETDDPMIDGSHTSVSVLCSLFFLVVSIFGDNARRSVLHTTATKRRNLSTL